MCIVIYLSYIFINSININSFYSINYLFTIDQFFRLDIVYFNIYNLFFKIKITW